MGKRLSPLYAAIPVSYVGSEALAIASPSKTLFVYIKVNQSFSNWRRQLCITSALKQQLPVCSRSDRCFTAICQVNNLDVWGRGGAGIKLRVSGCATSCFV